MWLTDKVCRMHRQTADFQAQYPDYHVDLRRTDRNLWLEFAHLQISQSRIPHIHFDRTHYFFLVHTAYKLDSA
jgi:hypothetical protein